MKLIIVRHAESERNAGKESPIDSSLTDSGKIQAKRLGKYFHKLKIDKVYCSTLKRAKDTFENIKPFIKKTPIAFTSKIVEQNIGIYGMNGIDNRKKLREDAKDRGVSVYDFKPKNGESQRECSDRASKFYYYLLKNHSKDSVLIVGHGLFNTFLILRALGLPIEEEKHIRLNNASVSTLNIGKNGKVKDFHINDYHHLIKEAMEEIS